MCEYAMGKQSEEDAEELIEISIDGSLW